MCIWLQAQPSDGLPQQVCITCISEINSAVSFKQKCERSERTLYSCLQRKPQLVDEPTACADPQIDDTVDQKFNIDIIYNDVDTQSGRISNRTPVEEDVEDFNMTYMRSEDDYLDSIDEPQDVEYIDEDALSEKPTSPGSAHDSDSVIDPHAHNDADDNVHENSADDYTDSEFAQLSVPPNQPSNTVDSQPPAPYQCPKCSATFVTERSLRIHAKTNKCTVHTFECPTCKRVFIHRRNLRMHMQQQHSADVAERTCTDCARCFDSADALQEHRLGGDCNNRTYRCTDCSKAFAMLSSLRDHLRTHTGERPFLCSICGKRFTQKANLRQHMLRHAQTKSFRCSRCPKTFVSKGELGQHTLSHTGVQPFGCKECGAEFTTSSSLVKHRRIHTGERPYACEHCPMRFAALSTLKNHRRTHTGEKPFECGKCAKSFRQRSDCVAHQRLHDGSFGFE